MMAKSVRWILIIAVLAIGGWWLVSGRKFRVEPGLSAEIDPAPFTDAAKDAQPVSQAVKPNGKGVPRKPNFVVILADASLVVAAEQLKSTRVFTLDRADFLTYRARIGRTHRAFTLID
jgi:hypothetical protein